MTGLAGASVAPMDSPASRDQVFTHIDSLHASRQVEAAEAYIQPRLTEARSAGDTTLIMPLASKLGRLWVCFGQQKRSEPLLREAVDLATVLGDSLSLADALRWLGLSVQDQGRAEEATAIFERQRAVSRARGDRRNEAWALVGLAYGASLDGRQEDAIADYRVAAEIFDELGDAGAEVWTLNGLGAALQAMGRYREASHCYDQVAELAQRIGYLEVEAMASNNRGSLEFAMGNPDLAMEHFRLAGQLQVELQQKKEATVSEGNVAICLVHLGRLDDAAALLDSLVTECELNNWPDREVHAVRTLADVRRLQGRSHQALAMMRDALASHGASLAFRTRVEGAVAISTILAEMDSSAAALEVLQEVENGQQGELQGALQLEVELALAARLQETGQPEEALGKYLKAIDASGAMGMPIERVTALAGVARCRRELGLPGPALEQLREAAGIWEETRATPLDPEWREQFGVTGRLVYAQLGALILGGPDSGKEAVTEAFDAVQIFKARTLAERIDIREDATGGPVMTLEKLQTEVLEEGELFLDAYLGPVESVLFAVTRDQCRAVLLPDEKALSERLRLQYELLATPPGPGDRSRARAVTAEAGARLGRELLGSFAALLGESRRVVFAPDGALNLVPLVALLQPTGMEHKLEWMRVPSATIFGFLRSGKEDLREKGKGILAVAAVETPDGRPLEGAMREVRQLDRRYRHVDIRQGGDPAHPLAAADLAGYHILHLAAHAIANDQRPWYSEIVWDAQDPAGGLRANSIAELDLSAQLAVLSACDTGAGRILSGEGVLGLSSAFLSAGVPAVLASLWPVEDKVTASLMDRFYRELSQGQAPVTALALAQDAIRSDPATAHPFHWAGFVIIGDGAKPVVLEAKSWPKTVAAFPLAGAVILVLVLVFGRRFRASKK